MSLVFQVEITMKQFDKASKNSNRKGKTIVIEQKVVSGDLEGNGRWFDRPRGAWESALKKAMVANMISEWDITVIGLTFDKDTTLKRINNGKLKLETEQDSTVQPV